jgi:hypothetical protein
MATATSPRRETNARLRQNATLETDGFTVKSLLKNAKVFTLILLNSIFFEKRNLIIGKCSTAS